MPLFDGGPITNLADSRPTLSERNRAVQLSDGPPAPRPMRMHAGWIGWSETALLSNRIDTDQRDSANSSLSTGRSSRRFPSRELWKGSQTPATERIIPS